LEVNPKVKSDTLVQIGSTPPMEGCKYCNNQIDEKIYMFKQIHMV